MSRSKQGVKRPPVDVDCLNTAIGDVLKMKNANKYSVNKKKKC